MMNIKYVNLEEKSLPSHNSEIFGEEYGNLDLMYRYIYLDCTHKERCCRQSLKIDKNVLNTDYDNLTLILIHADTFLNKVDNSLDILLKYWLHLGITKIILSSEDNFNIENEMKNKFKEFTLIPFDNSNNNKSKIINECIKKVNTEYLLLCDDNSFISESNFKDNFSLLSYYDFIFPSNRSFLKIDSIRINEKKSFIEDIETEKKEFLNFDYPFIFCNLNSLKKIGCFNPSLKSDKIMMDELNIRINMSDFLVKRNEESLYLFGLTDLVIDKDSETELSHIFNLSKLNDLNSLINQNEDMFYFSEEVTPDDYFDYSNDYKISVVIPVYNCQEFYLDRCIKSLKNQSIGFENIEIIIVDDGSKYKKSHEILKKYSEKYENVKTYFLEKNQGSGIARNFGINKVTTKYICFLDYDDYYIKSYCKNAYKSMEESDIDLFISNYVNLARKPFYLINWNFLNLVNNKKYLDDYEDDLNILKIDPSIWTKCYRKEFLDSNNISFSNYKVAQDNLFNVNTLFKAKGIELWNVPSVIYDTRDNEDEELKSRTLIINKEALLTRIKVYEEILELYNTYAPQEYLNKLSASLNYWTNSHLLKSNLNKKEFIEVVDTAHNLFNIRVKNKTMKIQEKFIRLFESIAYKNYDESYNIYLENKEII